MNSTHTHTDTLLLFMHDNDDNNVEVSPSTIPFCLAMTMHEGFYDSTSCQSSIMDTGNGRKAAATRMISTLMRSKNMSLGKNSTQNDGKQKL